MKSKSDSLQSLINTRPSAIKIAASSTFVQHEFLRHENGQLALFRAQTPGLDLLEWTEANAARIETRFRQHGAVLFRGFELANESSFGQFTLKLTGELIEYAEPSTPRTSIGNKLYTSTEYPPEQHIPLHNEQSYAPRWPMKIWFYCLVPAREGGQTPLADSRQVYERIDPRIRRVFEEKGVMYVRNYSEQLDLKWQDVFQTNDRREVEARCRQASIRYEWKAAGQLRTEQVCQGVFRHPHDGQMVWFNQAHLFHVSNLEVPIRDWLLENYGEENLPRNAYFGDGSRIAPAMLDEIRDAYHQSRIIFEWQTRDILMLDNARFAHGRQPFTGQRRVLVAMAEPFVNDEPLRQQTAPQVASGQRAVDDARIQTARSFVETVRDEQDHEILKYKLAATCRMMVSEGLDEGGISGHITVRVPGQPDSFWVNPFGLLADEVTPANLIKVNRRGQVLEGDYPVNVAGFCIHAAIHEARADVNCVVHTHSPWGTLFSALDQQIQPIDQNCCMFFENHTLLREYHGPVVSDEDAQQLAMTLADKNLIVLGNHGTITCGTTIETAVVLMVAAERAYRLNVLALQTGTLKLITPEVARATRDWIANPIGLAVEFQGLLRKVEKADPELRNARPENMKGH